MTGSSLETLGRKPDQSIWYPLSFMAEWSQTPVERTIVGWTLAWFLQCHMINLSLDMAITPVIPWDCGQPSLQRVLTFLTVSENWKKQLSSNLMIKNNWVSQPVREQSRTFCVTYTWTWMRFVTTLRTIHLRDQQSLDRRFNTQQALLEVLYNDCLRGK